MTKMKFREILANKANFAIHCKTASEAKALFGRLQKEGFKWWEAGKLDTNNTFWDICKKETVYCLNIETKKITYYWIGQNLFTKSATPFKDICFCEDCKVCDKI
jgi:hypothetical protein